LGVGINFFVSASKLMFIERRQYNLFYSRCCPSLSTTFSHLLGKNEFLCTRM